VLDTATMRKDAAEAGHTVLSTTITARQAYRYLLNLMGSRLGRGADALVAYWSAGPVRYQGGGHGDLVPAAVRNPVSVWGSPYGGFFFPPPDNADTQYRTLRQHAVGATADLPVPVLVGTFSEPKIAAFDPLSRVPLGPYQPAAATPANQASKKALSGSDLLPSLNLGGLVGQPVQLITTLAALPTLENSKYAGGAQLARAPVSVIRVRVAGVTGPDPASLNRIKTVAEQIEVRTHLTVDIVAGSSPAPTSIAVPAGKFGTPALLLTEGWVKKGVAVAIVNAVDRSSVALFVLILVVCALFVANSATAAVRGRRTELGVLTCLGWTRPRVFATVLGEVTLIGLTAGILGALLSPPLATALGLHASLARAALATEGALTGLAGSVAGAAFGLAGATIFARHLPPLLFAAAVAAVAAGVLVTCLAALLPAHLLRRLPAARLLAQE
jgi:putative ABC transport system permease protein